MRRFISMLMVAMMMAAMMVVSAMPAFAGPFAGGGDVDCKLSNGNIVQVVNVQACVALGGIVIDN